MWGFVWYTALAMRLAVCGLLAWGIAHCDALHDAPIHAVALIFMGPPAR